ncbi:MAG TPA: class I SAM-dependent methyltransferase [Rhizomicrobium sp.]
MSDKIDFRHIIETQKGIPGSLLEESAAVWCVLLDAQHATWNWEGLTRGDFLEIGVLHGKSASILAGFSRQYENRLTIIDPKIAAATRVTLNSISTKISYIECPSEQVVRSEFCSSNLRRMSFAHIDGMHRFSSVISDLQLCEAVLGNYGIISVDDFHTDLFPQIPAAVYKYLFSGVSDLCLFLIGLNKAYLCRNSAKKYFMKIAGVQLLPAIEKLGYKLTLVKTDRNDSFDAFGIASFYERRLYGSEHVMND